MGTRCRGLGEILARLTGPVRGQIVTRFQITERKSIIAQIVEIRAVRCSVPVGPGRRISRWIALAGLGLACAWPSSL